MDIEDVLLREAIRIGDELVSAAKKDENGIFWESIQMTDSGNYVLRKSENIYSGSSGIILFLLDLYKSTKDIKYLNYSLLATQWVEEYCNINPSSNYSFYTGRMGVAYLFLSVYDTTNCKNYLNKAVFIAKDCDKYLQHKPKEDLVTGAAGTLLVLLHLHSRLNKSWILRKITLYVNFLISRIEIGRRGIYWNRSNETIRGLCGFSHGASGVGFVFLELGQYFQNNCFYWIADQAFRYENYFYNSERKNWPDFRVGYKSRNEKKNSGDSFLNRNKSMYVDPKYTFAWCHGAPGIALARLRADSLLEDSSFYQEGLTKTIEKVCEVSQNDLYNKTATLCHGIAGNITLLLEVYKLNGDEKYLEIAKQTAVKICDFRRKIGAYKSGFYDLEVQEDNSLLMGNAGIGLFFLQVINPKRISSILFPIVQGKYKSKEINKELKIKSNSLLELILGKVFNLTLIALKSANVQEYKILLKKAAKSADFIECFVDSIRKNKNLHASNHRKDIREVFNFEYLKFLLDQSVESNHYLYLKQRSSGQYLKQNIGRVLEKLKSKSLILNEGVKIIRFRTHCSSVNIRDKKNNGETERSDAVYKVLKVTPDGILDFDLSYFSYFILKFFKRGTKIELVERRLYKEFSHIKAEELRNKLYLQIEGALSAGILKVC